MESLQLTARGSCSCFLCWFEIIVQCGALHFSSPISLIFSPASVKVFLIFFFLRVYFYLNFYTLFVYFALFI